MEDYAHLGRKEVPLRTIDKNTGEIKDVKVKGLWSHFPIPAYQVLAIQKQWSAQRLLSCFVSFLGADGLCVFPSYKTISKRCGLSPNTIRKALDVLEENGFIKTFYFKEGKKDSASRAPTSKCLDCGALMDRGGYGNSEMLGKIHYGCGGSVVGLKALASVRAKRNASA
jgi:hypothetical protein